MFKKMKLSTKFLIVGISLISLLSFGLMLFFSFMFHKKTIESFVSKARSIAMAAESVRLEMDEKWQKGIFTTEQARGYFEKQKLDLILNMVPVVTAWRSAMKKAADGQYEFRVPKFSPRNPRNMPDYGLDSAIEGPAIEKIKKLDLDEYYVIDEKKNAVRYFLPIRLSETCLMCHGDPATSKELWGIADGKDPTGGTMENWNIGEIHGAFEIIQSLDPADKEIWKNLSRAFLITGFGLLFVGGCYYLLVKKIVVGPIEHVSMRLENIARGDADLTQRLTTANEDEIGALVGNFNCFLDNLQTMIRQVSNDTQTINSASQQLTDISKYMSGTSTRTSSKTENVYSSADIMSGNMHAIAAAMEEATANITMMASAAEEVSATLSEISHNSDKARSIAQMGMEQSQRASTQIGELDNIAQDIGKVTETISEISDQTNLLALNATIEAARAGEAGKGFTIVAQEIKTLSFQTADATNRIKGQIETVQEAISVTLKEIRGMSDVIKDINAITLTVADAVIEQTTATTEISGNISQASAAIGEINEKVAQSSIMAQSVHNDLEDLSKAAQDVAESSENIATSVGNLKKMASNLKGMIEKFKI